MIKIIIVWIRGTIGDYADQDWYEITIPRGNGYSQIEIKPSADNPLNDSAWRIEICDKNRHTLRSYTAGANKDAKIGLVAGKYYIIVKCQYSNIGLDGTYNLMAHYTASKEWELERYFRDKNPRNANIVYLNRRYTGSLYCNDDVDYYRFKLNGTNRVIMDMDQSRQRLTGILLRKSMTLKFHTKRKTS